MPIKVRTRFLHNRLTPVIIVFGLVMVGFGLLLYVRLDDMLNMFENEWVQTRANNAAKIYSREIVAELDRLTYVARIMENDKSDMEADSVKTAVTFIERSYTGDPNAFLGLLAANGDAVYGEKLSPQNYTGILYSLRGRECVSYTPSGGILFSCPVMHGGNIRYVLYELCSSSNYADRFRTDSLGDLGRMMVMTRDGDIVVDFADVPKENEKFYSSRSVREVFQKLIAQMDLKPSNASLEQTTLGEMYFYTAEVDDTDFILAGMVQRSAVSDGLTGIPVLVLTVFSLLVIMVMALAFFLMITSQRLRESVALKRAKAAAEEASRAKSDFLANMSHEIRTPINTILGMDEMILREYNDPTLRKYAANIQNSGRTLLSLINDVLDFSRIEAGRMELYPDEYDLALVIVDMVSMIRSMAVKKGLTFDVDVDESIPHILYGDNVRIRQVILNLLTNAVKYTKEGGVVLSVHYKELDDENISLDVAVKDTGIGIKEDDVDKLFSPFQRLDEERNRTIEGTGLGMNIVRNLLALMDSEPHVVSEYGRGSTFSFSIIQHVLNWEPMGDFEEAFNEAVENEEVYQASFVAPKARILLVDDTEMNLMVVKGLLKNTDLEIDTASDGKQALSLTEKREYDVLLIDHRMPVMDGIEMIKELRVMTDNVNSAKPCIALTANAVAGAREEYISAGFDDYLIKPVVGAKLEQMLIKYLDEDKVTLAENVNVDNTEENAQELDEMGMLRLFEEKGYLDIKEGIGYAGSAEMYVNVIKFFVSSIDAKSEEIRKYYNEGDWDNYVAKVHALKSSARVIGADELSNRARYLELAGNDRDFAYIREHTGDVLAFYGSYKEKLKGIG